MLHVGRLRDREQRGAAGQETERHLARARSVCFRDVLQHLTSSRAWAWEASMPERAVRDDGDVMPLTPRNHRVLDRALLKMVEHLIAGDAAGAGDLARLFKVGFIEIAHTPAHNLAF